VVDGLEIACRATRLVEWMPRWHRIYPNCTMARWSSDLDLRWQTGRWPIHDADGWEAWDEWFEGVEVDESKGHWHVW